MTSPSQVRIGIDAHLLSFAGTYRQAGVSRYIAELLRAFAAEQAGESPFEYLAYIGREQPPADFLPPGAGRLHWRQSQLPTERAPVRIAWEQGIGPAAALRERLDLLHGPVNVLPLAAPCRGVITIHDLAFLAHPEAFNAAKRRYLTVMTALSARRSARVIAVSHFTRLEVIRRLGIAPSKVAVVHNAADPTFAPRPADEIARFRAAHDLPARFILSVGTLEPRKNLTGLLDAFAKLAADTDADLVIVGGQGWLYDDALARVAALGLAGRVRFAGHVPDGDLPLWYNAAAAFVYPSLYEGFGLPPLEALACGTPTITSAAASLPEVVGEAAILVEPRDPDAIAAALRQVLTDPSLRARLSAAGPPRAATFTWARTAAATRAVYAEALAR
ncbi:MAG: glycosyltransferase family 1 protein [Thermomicrobiales bacterium]